MAEPFRDLLARQLDTAWSLASYHLHSLTDAECQWRPAQKGLHIWPDGAGSWRADWPDHEGYDLGPSSIGWTTWHLAMWWTLAHDRTFGTGALERSDVVWPGSAEATRSEVHRLRDQWRGTLTELSDADLARADRVRWPFEARPLGDLFAWANIELTKNAAEIGYGRFLYATRVT